MKRKKKVPDNGSTNNEVKKEIPGKEIEPQYLKDNTDKKPSGKPLHG